MPERGEDVSLVETTGAGALTITVPSRRSSPGDVPVLKTPSDESLRRTPSERHLTLVPPVGYRSRTCSDASHQRTSRKASLALSFDERGSYASVLPHDEKVPHITIASADPNSADHPSNKTPDQDDLEDPQVEDSAYSWVVAAGAALQFVLVGGIHKSFGLVLGALVQEHGFTAAQVAVIPALYFAINFMVSPICGALCRRLSERYVAVLGGIGSLLGLALSGLTSNIYMLYITNGVVFGIGQGFANVPGMLMVSKYFVKRRGLANAITAASAAIGGVFFPLMVQAMLEEYGLPGTYLLLAGIHLHTIISATLYRPMDKQREIMRLERRRRLRRERRSALQDQKAPQEMEKSSLPDEAPSSAQLLPAGRDKSHMAEMCDTQQEDGLLHPPLRHRQARGSLATSTSMISQINLAVEAPAAPPSAGCWQQVLRSLDLHLLADPLYLACVASVFLFMTGLPHVCLLVPRFALEIGVSQSQVATMIS